MTHFEQIQALFKCFLSVFSSQPYLWRESNKMSKHFVAFLCFKSQQSIKRDLIITSYIHDFFNLVLNNIWCFFKTQYWNVQNHCSICFNTFAYMCICLYLFVGLLSSLNLLNSIKRSLLTFKLCKPDITTLLQKFLVMDAFLCLYLKFSSNLVYLCLLSELNSLKSSYSST